MPPSAFSDIAQTVGVTIWKVGSYPMSPVDGRPGRSAASDEALHSAPAGSTSSHLIAARLKTLSDSKRPFRERQNDGSLYRRNVGLGELRPDGEDAEVLAGVAAGIPRPREVAGKRSAASRFEVRQCCRHPAVRLCS